MDEQKIVITRGLPASGKSTWAKSVVEAFPRTWKRINKDDLRSMITNSVWDSEIELSVVAARNSLIRSFLGMGFSVIVDDTNIEFRHIKDIFHLISSEFPTVTLEVKTFDVDINECIARDKQRPVPVGKSVIRRMADRMDARANDVDHQLTELNKHRYFPSFYENTGERPKIILVDIDGTIAKHTNRSPFEWHRVLEDLPKYDIIDSVASIAKSLDAGVIFLSGRDGSCYELTRQWLEQHFHERTGINYALYLRDVNDNRKDYIVKRELFDMHIRDNYDVVCVFDDRDQVVHMWRKQLNLTVFQVDYGNF